MPPVGFETRISAGEWPKTYALDRTATGTGITETITSQISVSHCPHLFVQTFSCCILISLVPDFMVFDQEFVEVQLHNLLRWQSNFSLKHFTVCSFMLRLVNRLHLILHLTSHCASQMHRSLLNSIVSDVTTNCISWRGWQTDFPLI
jgi:hypothetical protein